MPVRRKIGVSAHLRNGRAVSPRPVFQTNSHVRSSDVSQDLRHEHLLRLAFHVLLTRTEDYTDVTFQAALWASVPCNPVPFHSIPLTTSDRNISGRTVRPHRRNRQRSALQLPRHSAPPLPPPRLHRPPAQRRRRHSGSGYGGSEHPRRPNRGGIGYSCAIGTSGVCRSCRARRMRRG